MNLDIRFPIGLMFTVFGLVLTPFGLVSNRALYEKSLGLNINLWWGLVLLLFGLVMLVFAIKAQRGGGPPNPPGPGPR